MKPLHYFSIAAIALTSSLATALAQTSLPTSADETQAIIAARGQLTSAPTVYIWMLDAELEYDADGNPVKPLEHKNTTGDKNDNWYMIRMRNGATYDTPISNNIVADNPALTNGAAILDNYGYNSGTGQYDFTSWRDKPDDYRLARIKVVDTSGGMKDRDELTTIRGRGNSTWECDKKAYRLKFPSKTKFLAAADGTNDYADAKNWTLLANAADRTMMRNALTSEVVRRIKTKTGATAMPFAPAYKFVDLVLNDMYLGTYQVSDHVQIQTGRIEIDEDNGWFLEGVGTEEKFVENPHINFEGISWNDFTLNVKNPEDTYYTKEVENNIRDYVAHVFALAKEPYDFSEATGLFKYVDIESVVDYFIGTEVSGNYDGLISNYAYRDVNPDDKLKVGPLWDSDIAYGNFGNLKEGFVFNNGKMPSSTLSTIARALTKSSPEFVRLLNERWDVVYSDQPGNYPYDNGLSNHLYYRIEDMKAAIGESQQLNYTAREQGGAGWSLQQPIMSWVGGSYNSYDDAIAQLRQFIIDHNHWLNTAIHQLKENMMASDYRHDATATATSLGDHAGKICKTTVVNRTLNVGEWNTICLPFSLTKDKLQATFGDDVVLMEYRSVANGKMVFAEVADKRLVAGIPYLIKPSKVEALVFDDVALSCPQPATVSYADNPAYAFTGTYFTTGIAADGTTMLLDARNEEFRANSSERSLTGCSAYITCPSGTTTMPLFSAVSLPDGQDNTALLADLNGKTIDLVLEGRTFYHDGSWNTLCLPFALDSFEGTPLEGATVMKFEKKQTSFAGSTLTIGFSSESTKINAGKPYLVKWTDGAGEVKDPTFRNVTVSTTEPGSYEATDVHMLGTFSPVTLQSGDTRKLYLGDGNKLYYPSADVTVNACRAYFVLQGDLTAGEPSEAQAVSSLVLNFDGEETAISEIYDVMSAPAADDAWYTLDGRRLGGKPTARGIYINRGRKVVIQ